VQAILQRQVAEIEASLPALADAAERAGRAYDAHDIDALALTPIDAALLSRRLERIAARLALQEQAIALQALLGTRLNVPERAASAAGVNPGEKPS